MNMNRIKLPGRQNGAALVVGLILMVVITVLAISGMNTATTELAMARNDQNYENAFQAAETGLENALAQGRFNTIADVNLTQHYVNPNDSVTAVIKFETTTLVPDRGFSMGVGSGIAAYHFNAEATAKSERDPGTATDRDATAVHTQAFYVVGPEASSL
jgi:type IV pilus assembly protein PilX